jgi:hypothetical protein
MLLIKASFIYDTPKYVKKETASRQSHIRFTRRLLIPADIWNLLDKRKGLVLQELI